MAGMVGTVTRAIFSCPDCEALSTQTPNGNESVSVSYNPCPKHAPSEPEPVDDEVERVKSALRVMPSEVGSEYWTVHNTNLDEAADLLDRLKRERDEARAELTQVRDWILAQEHTERFEIADEIDRRIAKLQETKETDQ